MTLQQVFFGAAEFLVSVLISFFLVFATYKFILLVTRHFDEEKQLRMKNVSVGVVLGSILLGQAIVVKQAIYPVMAVIQIFVLGGQRSVPDYLKVLGLSVGYILMSGSLAILVIFFCFWLFDRLTPGIDQYHEIRQNNLAIAIFMGLLIVGVSLLVGSGVSALTRALIPFPTVGSLPLE
jgi:uncharacterized membrane protein YjfL (UPF0719 family)